MLQKDRLCKSGIIVQVIASNHVAMCLDELLAEREKRIQLEMDPVDDDSNCSFVCSVSS